MRREVETVTRDTAGFTGLTVNLAINYGGRDEIVRAVNRLLSDGACAVPSAELRAPSAVQVSEERLRACLDHPQVPDPDLIIRTGGEYRISNFLLWGAAYAELDFSPKLWPDWTGEDLVESLRHYQGRERRFGGAT